MSQTETSPFPEFSDAELELHLVRVAEKGADYIGHFLSKAAVLALQKLCESLDFKEVVEQHEKVSERYFVPKNISPLVEIVVSPLGKYLKNRLESCAGTYPILHAWDPSDFSIQLYDRSSYITSHRDHNVYRGLIVICAFQGESVFEASNERHSAPFLKEKMSVGDAVFLRGAGMVSNIEGHPGIFHSISGALTDVPRISLAFRDKT